MTENTTTTCKKCVDSPELEFPPHDSLQHHFCVAMEGPNRGYERWHVVLSRVLTTEEHKSVEDAFLKLGTMEAFLSAAPPGVTVLAMQRRREIR